MKQISRPLPFSRARGFTMLEVMVSTAIFSLVIATALQISAFTAKSTSEKITESNLQVKGERTLKLVVEEISSSANLGVGAKGNDMTYYSPLDLDENGYALTQDDGLLEYGVVTESETGVGNMTLQFVPNRTIIEADEGVDLNRDGDMADEFEMGHISRGTSISGELQVIGVDNIIQRKDNYGASVLDDSNPASDTTGRLFTESASSDLVTVSIWLVAISKDRLTHLVHCRSMVFLRNQ